MAEASIALNRFGLGSRPGDAAVDRPRRALLDQLDRYDARPELIATLPPSQQIASDLADYLAAQREIRRDVDRPQRSAPRAPQTDPAMREDAAMRDAPATAGADDADPVKQARQFARQQAQRYYATGVQARMQVAILSDAPFVERLVHFWSNHFAVSIDKLTTVGLAGAFEFEAIRPHVLGRFRDMLHAAERHPAMLLYLDQVQSIGPNSRGGQLARSRQGRQPGLNENLAREILELHTLGVRTGYSQEDVTEFARAMTGWSVSGLGRGRGARFAGADGEPGRFMFAPVLHEPGARMILGQRYGQEGEAQASAVLDMLAAHPATARHLATKLARHFAGDDPPPALVARLEKAYLASDGDLPTLYRALVEAPECWVAPPLKFKAPWEWSVSALRALGAREVQPQASVGLLRQLGQPVWQPGSPAGWDDIAASWAGPDAILRRVEAAQRFGQRTRDTIDARARAEELFPAALSPGTAQAIARAESPGQGVALMLVAPEFLRR